MNISASHYRVDTTHIDLHHECLETDLGLLLMATTAKGVCFAQFGDRKQDLLQQLNKDFPGANITTTPLNNLKPNDWINSYKCSLKNHTAMPDLPLDLRGTPFQITVWNYLTHIPAGNTISYTELANGIQKPKAIRAAASACAANKIALLVPCHRVLRNDGKMGGYRWGLERKEKLLALERSAN